jgi:hypothetical protein
MTCFDLPILYVRNTEGVDSILLIFPQLGYLREKRPDLPRGKIEKAVPVIHISFLGMNIMIDVGYVY